MVLNGGQRVSMTSRDGSFAFQDVPAGVYLLEVLSTTFHYSAVKIKVDDTTGIIAIEYKVYNPLAQHCLPRLLRNLYCYEHVLISNCKRRQC